MNKNGSKRVERLIKQQQTKEQEQQEVSKIAVGYVRVSTEEQATKGFGLGTQEKAIRAFAESQGYELLEVVSDPGVSGATQPDKREGFKRVLELAETGSFSVLLVWKIDRLARSIVHAVTCVNELRESHSVLLRSVTEPIDTATAMGQTIFAILAGMAQQERHVITERTLSGRKAKAKQGGFAGASAPYGYRSDGQGHLVIYETEAVTVRQIFERRNAGKTLQEIADWLNSEGTPTRRGGKWYPATVRYILDNPKYKGQVEYLFKWQGEHSHVISAGKHAAIIGA